MTREEAIYVLNELLEKVKASQNKTNILAKEKQALEMAIEALEENESLARSVNEASELLRKKRPRGEWIPCSERLPDKEEKIYLVTIDYGDGLSCIAPRFFWNKERLWNEAEEYITAWMPLPEPYKEGGDSDA